MFVILAGATNENLIPPTGYHILQNALDPHDRDGWQVIVMPGATPQKRKMRSGAFGPHPGSRIRDGIF
jgi:hypothetical protein